MPDYKGGWRVGRTIPSRIDADQPRALNESLLVARDTKRRIVQIADQMDYQINASARAGRQQLLCLTEDSVQLRLRTRGFVYSVESAAGLTRYQIMLLENRSYETNYEFIHANVESVEQFDGIFVQFDISSIRC